MPIKVRRAPAIKLCQVIQTIHGRSQQDLPPAVPNVQLKSKKVLKSITGLHHARCSALNVEISHTGSSCLQQLMKIFTMEPGIVPIRKRASQSSGGLFFVHGILTKPLIIKHKIPLVRIQRRCTLTQILSQRY
jgi:hypothetical protein